MPRNAAKPLPTIRETGRIPDRGARADGDATRASILEAAGRLFAERGYAEATSKAICERAGVNMAAVNYHFGSREGLYLAVLEDVHRRVVSIDFLRGLSGNGADPREQLQAFFDELLRRILDDGNWPIRVWAREVLAPSPVFDRVLREQAQPKFELVSGIVARITGCRRNDPRLPRLVLSVIAPCLTMLVVDRRAATPIASLFAQSPKALAAHFCAFALAGLDAAGRAKG